MQLVASYLYKRKLRVNINNAWSDWEDLHKDILQGSILGLLILKMFLNGMFYFVNKGSAYNCADDNYLSVQLDESGLVKSLKTRNTSASSMV